MRYAVILAGGSGSRLWPASRRARPKQFLALGAPGGDSLIAATARRVEPTCPADQLIVVTAASQVAQVREALPALPASGVIAEPVGRNTAAALGLAAVYLVHRDPDAVMGALPADQHVADEAELRRVVDRAFDAAVAHDAIVTVGIVPTRPETGFGYLQVGDDVGDGVSRVASFVEKPDASTAQRYLIAGNYLWNAGMFFVSARKLLAEIETHMPETYAVLDDIRATLASDGPEAAAELTERAYPTLDSISIDYGVMERADGVLTIAGNFGWNDVGSWSALADYRDADADGNVTEGTVITHDASNNIAIGSGDTIVALVGVSDLVVVQSGNAVLVVPRDRAQDVREVVRALEAQELKGYL